MRRLHIGIGLGALVVLAGLTPVVRHSVPRAADPFSYLFTDDREGQGQLGLVATKCGTERWPVKTGADYDRNAVNVTAKSSTIQSLTTAKDPKTYQQSNRSSGSERQEFKIRATLTEYKLEADGDVHLVLSDGHRTLIAEIPDPSCVASNSRWTSQIKAARAAFAKAYSVSTSWHYPKHAVTVVGIGFFDPPHNQTGAASDDLELHPVVSFTNS